MADKEIKLSFKGKKKKVMDKWEQIAKPSGKTTAEFYETVLLQSAQGMLQSSDKRELDVKQQQEQQKLELKHKESAIELSEED